MLAIRGLDIFTAATMVFLITGAAKCIGTQPVCMSINHLFAALWRKRCCPVTVEMQSDMSVWDFFGTDTTDAAKRLSTSIKHTQVRAERDADCTICLEDFATSAKTSTLPCGHVICIPCISRWIAQSPLCPINTANTPRVVSGITLYNSKIVVKKFNFRLSHRITPLNLPVIFGCPQHNLSVKPSYSHII
jgi:hypothetical protein